MSEPKRIQRKRTRGWRMPEGAVYVGRPTIFGNPFRATYLRCSRRWIVRDDNGMDYEPHYNSEWSAVRKAVQLYDDEATYWLGGRMRYDPDFCAAVEELRGKDLCCWCRLDVPCHADVLLALANKEPAHV